MISLEELNEIKEKRKTNLYYEEKEYLQYIFLNAISEFPDNFVFKGGTCLRICYGFERASEDLDFSTNLKLSELKKLLKKLLKDFELLNINYKIYSEKDFEGNYRLEARFEGPLFNGNSNSTNTLKIDFNKRKIFNKSARIIPKLFSDVPQFTIVALSEEELLAEKIRALINRKQPRDMYDIWALFGKGININKKFLAKKLREENSKLSELKFPSKEEYKKDLRNLILYLPDYEQVKKEIMRNLPK